jgi:Mn2+/Fe2+ NRAMP family transporter
MRIDVWSGMGFSNLVMFFIIAACGATLYAHGITDIQSAEQAAQAIRPFGGDLTYALFALGVIGTGMLAIPVLAGSSAYALSEAFGWKHGLNRPLAHATAFYGVIIVSLAIGALANLLGVNPIRMLVLSAVCNGVIAPFILFFIVALSIRLPAHNTKPVMAVVGYAITAALFVVGCAALYQLF